MSEIIERNAHSQENCWLFSVCMTHFGALVDDEDLVCYPKCRISKESYVPSPDGDNERSKRKLNRKELSWRKATLDDLPIPRVMLPSGKIMYKARIVSIIGATTRFGSCIPWKKWVSSVLCSQRWSCLTPTLAPIMALTTSCSHGYLSRLIVPALYWPWLDQFL